ncbi:MAG: ParB/RepB/Spo0J family partition protein [Opitutaceae bacterium]|nr:ParB/RepB/Spo0J family partition protein [Opitutaceae bacterium]
MATPSKSRLGRGLGALITSGAPAPKPAAAAAPAVPPADMLAGYREIPVHVIEPNPYQPRRDIDAEQLSDLVESIRAEGLLQPIVVRPVGDRFQLIAGERRWRAFQQLKLKSIPARVMTSSDASSASLALIENLQREGLNPIDEAHGYASLIRDFDLTQDAAAQRVGKGRATVANSLRLLALEAEIQGYVGKGMLSVGHAKVLLGVENSAERMVLARRTLEQGLSVRALEDLLKHSGGGAGKKRRLPAATATALSDIEKKLTSHLGARTTLRHSPKRGRIIIEYAGNEDLQRVIEKMGVTL